MDESDMVGGSGELHGWSWGGYFGAYILTRYTDGPVDSKLFRFGVCVCVFSFGESVVYIIENEPTVPAEQAHTSFWTRLTLRHESLRAGACSPGAGS